MPKRRRRSKAHTEEILAALDDARQDTGDDRTRALLHELQLHAEVITAQNEELRKTQAELEEATSRYADLYDLAPIGFLALDQTGLILDINIAGAMLLGVNRPFARGLPITATIQQPQRRRLRELLRICWQRGPSVTTTFDLATRRDPVRLLRFTSRLQSGYTSTRLFTAVVDVTEENKLEVERVAALQRELARGRELTQEVAERTRAEQRVKALLERLVKVQEEERRRIARNLHDHLGQQMTALRLTIGALRGGPLSAEELRDRLEMLDRIATQIDRDVDTIAWDLRPAALDDVGLDGALATLVNEWSTTHGVPAEFHVSEPNAIRLTGEVESHLYRIVQEALNNVTKHAAATRVSVLLERRDLNVIVIVEDDGRGFDVDAKSEAKGERGMGLIGMQERASLVGGVVQIESAPGKGTTLFVQMPVHPAIHRLVARKQGKSQQA